MGAHDEFLELCAVSTSGELTEVERKKLEEHLAACPSCRKAMKEFELAAGRGVQALAYDFPDSQDNSDASWSVEKAEAEFFERLKTEDRSLPAGPENAASSSGQRFTYQPSRIRWREIWMPFAACVLLALALGIAAYRSGMRQGADVARLTAPPPRNPLGTLQEQVSDSGHEHAQLVAQLGEQDRVIAELKRQLADQTVAIGRLKATNGTIQSSEQKGTAGVAGENGFEEEFGAAQAKLQELQKKIDAGEQQRSEVTARAEGLEAKVDELNRLLRGQGETMEEQHAQIAKQQEFLEHDRDIRELMGARDLYIAEVYDVARTGKTNKTYGRVFYTKGKSLIFYAYDLDQQAGLRNASSFQAWGRRGPDKEQALNLGVFFEDSATKKRWVLKFDDPKTLDQIDAVFVTLEPNGGSHHPSGKQLLFAYLRVNPNHP
jgi:anti-sigma factor RsiW